MSFYSQYSLIFSWQFSLHSNLTLARRLLSAFHSGRRVLSNSPLIQKESWIFAAEFWMCFHLKQIIILKKTHQENDVWKAMITSATRLCRPQMWLFTGFCTLELSHMQFVIIWKVFMIMIIRATHLLNHSFIHIIVEKAFMNPFSFLLIFTQLDVPSIYR